MFNLIHCNIRLLKKHSLVLSVQRTNVTGNTKKDRRESLQSFSDIPGPRSLPVIGTIHQYLPFIGNYNTEALDKNALFNWRRYGPLVREQPGVPVLHIYDPEDIEALFRQDNRYPARRSHVAMNHYRLSKPSVYNSGGLLATNGPVWWRLRSAFQKNFTSPQNVKIHVETTDAVAKKLVQFIKKHYTDGDDFIHCLNRLNLETIGLVAFNESFHSFSAEEQDPDSRTNKIIASAFGSNSGIMKLDSGFLWRYMSTPLYRKLAKSQEVLEKIVRDILLECVSFFESEAKTSDSSLLTSFLEQKNIDLKDVTGMMVDILMAAIDTTAYSTSFALYHLARNKFCQDKVFEEALNLLPSKNMTVSAEILAKANYLRCCVKESLRLNPVSVGIGRLLQKDIVLKGYLIPEGTVVVTQNMVASRLPQYVRDPLKFKPDRWLRNTPDYENLHPFLSLPFGFGPRSCIARRLAEQNICITILRLIREFDIKWVGEDLDIKTYLINKPDKAIALSFLMRNI